MVMSMRMTSAAASTPVPPAPVSHARPKPPGRRKRRQRGALAAGRKKRTEQQAHERRHKNGQGNIKRIQTVVENFSFQAVPLSGGGSFIGLRQLFQQQAFRFHPQCGSLRPFHADSFAFQQGRHCQKAPAALSGAAVHRRSPSRPAEGNQRGNSIRSMAAGFSSMIRETSIHPRITSKLRERDKISFWASVRFVSPNKRISRTARVISSQRSASCA